MTEQVQWAFPPNGKVLIVGMPTKEIPSSYNKRISYYNIWEVIPWSNLPRDVVAISVSDKLRPEVMKRLKTLAEQAGVTQFNEERSSEMLRARLDYWFKKDNSVDKDSNLQPVQTVGEARVLVKRLKPLEGQPRTHFSASKMNELMTSIKMIGQQDPVKVVKVENDSDYDYQLIDGERRFRAIIMLGLPEIWAVVCVVKNAEDQFMKSFAANFAREGHTPMDTARAISKMLSFPEFKEMSRGSAIKKIAGLAGKSDQWAYAHIKLLNLPEEVRDMLEPDEKDEYKLPLSMGLFLCTIDDRDIQLRVCREVVSSNLSMNKARNVARRLAIEAGKKAGSAQRRPTDDYRILANYLRKTIEGVEQLLDMPHRSLDELFAFRGLQERKDRMLDVQKAIELLTQLRDALDIRKSIQRK